MHYINPKSTAACIIVKNKKVLLIKRKDNPFIGYWSLPGGHIELFERAEHTIKREIKEELGLIIKPKFFCINQEIFKNVGWHATVFAFTSSKLSGNLKIKKKEIGGAKFFSRAEIKNLKMGFNHKDIINDFFKHAKH